MTWRVTVTLLVITAMTCGCVRHVARADLGRMIDAERAPHADAAHPAVPIERAWRYAGQRGDEHIVVHVWRDAHGVHRERYAVAARDLIMPVALTYGDDESRWLPLRLVRHPRADGTLEVDFVRLSAAEIDAAHHAVDQRTLKVGL